MIAIGLALVQPGQWVSVVTAGELIVEWKSNCNLNSSATGNYRANSASEILCGREAALFAEEASMRMIVVASEN
jgi:hypothetical protein